jgi:two-component sensor histidine kinase
MSMPAPVSILIIDDDELMREINGKLLRSNGYSVYESATGDQGVMVAREKRPDIILLDVELPDVSGMDVCVTLRRELVENDAMIALMSGIRLSPDDRSAGFESGADAFIAKPVGNRELLARVNSLERILDSRRALMQSVREREELVRTLHNRIKNDLYTVESFISLRQNGLDNAACVHMLDDLKHRVHSIAAIHESLYVSGNLVSVDSKLYLENLMGSFVSGQTDADRRIRVNVTVQSMPLDADLAIAVGMTATELVSNAITHAFPDDRAGSVSVEFFTRGNAMVLVVEDDGTGFPDATVEPPANALGLKIVSMLLERLGATLDRSSGKGTRYAVNFGNLGISA